MATGSWGRRSITVSDRMSSVLIASFSCAVLHAAVVPTAGNPPLQPSAKDSSGLTTSNTSPQEVGARARSDAKRKIVPGDSVTVSVFELVAPGHDFIHKARVDPEGNLECPIIGRLAAEGLTPSQLNKRIALVVTGKGQLKDPTVKVTVRSTPQTATRRARGRLGRALPAAPPAPGPTWTLQSETITIWAIILIIGIVGSVLALRWTSRVLRVVIPPFCTRCRYSLYGLQPIPPQCPECGSDFFRRPPVDKTRLHRRQIIWCAIWCASMFLAISSVFWMLNEWVVPQHLILFSTRELHQPDSRAFKSLVVEVHSNGFWLWPWESLPGSLQATDFGAVSFFLQPNQGPPQEIHFDLNATHESTGENAAIDRGIPGAPTPDQITTWAESVGVQLDEVRIPAEFLSFFLQPTWKGGRVGPRTTAQTSRHSHNQTRKWYSVGIFLVMVLFWLWGIRHIRK